jgi:catechol 2,3-dioxygenase-like lactoylglutathione lyase family enzyme
MKRFHVHVAVEDLAASIRFYSTLFGTDPAVLKDDYAKWMLDDPRVNFAVSRRGGSAGINHLGLQTDSDAELEQLNAQLQQAELAIHAEKETACCYARSNKYWVTDPTGIAWETFHTLGSLPTFGEEPAAAAGADACCAPAVAEPVRVVAKAAAPSVVCCR